MRFKKGFSRWALLSRWALFAGLAGGLLGCAAVGPTDDPVLRSLTWDRYVGGDDIDRACAPGQPDRYRLVYNAQQDEQRRTYEIGNLSEGGAMLEVRVIGQAALNDPHNPVSVRDPLAPWRGQTALYRMSPDELALVTAALRDVGFERPAPTGLLLRGDSFYWTASACRDGVFHFHAWASPDPGFERVTKVLMAALRPFDKTNVPVREPFEVALPPYSTYFNATDGDVLRRVPHRLQVGENGLKYSQGTIN